MITATLIVLGTFSGMASTFIIGGIIAAKRPVDEFRAQRNRTATKVHPGKHSKHQRRPERINNLVPALR